VPDLGNPSLAPIIAKNPYDGTDEASACKAASWEATSNQD